MKRATFSASARAPGAAAALLYCSTPNTIANASGWGVPTSVSGAGGAAVTAGATDAMGAPEADGSADADAVAGTTNPSQAGAMFRSDVSASAVDPGRRRCLM